MSAGGKASKAARKTKKKLQFVSFNTLQVSCEIANVPYASLSLHDPANVPACPYMTLQMFQPVLT